jgi:large subunit ribosomal protein L4
VVDKMDLASHKTRDLKAALGTLGIEGKALFVDARGNENFERASRNVRSWKLVDPLGVNAYDVLAHGTVVLTKSAFSRVVKNLGGE